MACAAPGMPGTSVAPGAAAEDAEEEWFTWSAGLVVGGECTPDGRPRACPAPAPGPVWRKLDDMTYRPSPVTAAAVAAPGSRAAGARCAPVPAGPAHVDPRDVPFGGRSALPQRCPL